MDLEAVLRIRISMDPHHFWKFKVEKLDPDPDPHQNEKMEALEGHFGALRGPNSGNSEC
jgi:hypothetical protein